MLTSKQKKWLDHLSDNNHIKIIPYDIKTKNVFNTIKQEILSFLGEDAEVLHKGATNMGISGKGDIDVYIPVEPSDFDQKYIKIKNIYGEPGSFYPLERVRWNKEVEGIEVEIFLINKTHPGWTESVLFEDYLNSHPEALNDYRSLKENAEGVSTREYYRRKLEFMNKILEKAKSS